MLARLPLQAYFFQLIQIFFDLYFANNKKVSNFALSEINIIIDLHNGDVWF